MTIPVPSFFTALSVALARPGWPMYCSVFEMPYIAQMDASTIAPPEVFLLGLPLRVVLFARTCGRRCGRRCRTRSVVTIHNIVFRSLQKRRDDPLPTIVRRRLHGGSEMREGVSTNNHTRLRHNGYGCYMAQTHHIISKGVTHVISAAPTSTSNRLEKNCDTPEWFPPPCSVFFVFAQPNSARNVHRSWPA